MFRFLSTALLATSLLATGYRLPASAGVAASQLRLTSSSGELTDPFASPLGTKAIVLIFVSVDCPISNRYAPELRRLHDRFAPEGAVFRLIYPNPTESADAIRLHLKEFGYRWQALRDPRQELVNLTKVTVTPEAAVYDTSGRLVYRGRIDDRYVNPGLQRPQPTRRDLEDALTATFAGTPVRRATAPAVGCFIADFVP